MLFRDIIPVYTDHKYKIHIYSLLKEVVGLKGLAVLSWTKFQVFFPTLH
jgi:hypothetical protein